jgi:hypothetical protein
MLESDMNFPKKELPPNFHEITTNALQFKIMLRMTFCAWKEGSEEQEEDELGQVIKTSIPGYVYDRTSPNRIMNEDGSDYIFSKIYPYINPVTATGSLDANTMYASFDGAVDAINWELPYLHYFGIEKRLNGINRVVRDPYEYQIERHESVIATICEYYNMFKGSAEKGFKMSKYSDNIFTGTVIRSGMQPEKKAGILDNVLGKK